VLKPKETSARLVQRRRGFMKRYSTNKRSHKFIFPVTKEDKEKCQGGRKKTYTVPSRPHAPEGKETAGGLLLTAMIRHRGGKKSSMEILTGDGWKTNKLP